MLFKSNATRKHGCTRTARDIYKSFFTEGHLPRHVTIKLHNMSSYTDQPLDVHVRVFTHRTRVIHTRGALAVFDTLQSVRMIVTADQ
jgi:hypothetical protein